MNKNIFLVISVQKGGKRYAYVRKQSYNNNLLCLSDIHGAEIAHLCRTLTQAQATAAAWNAAYKANDNYLFDCPSF